MCVHESARIGHDRVVAKRQKKKNDKVFFYRVRYCSFIARAVPRALERSFYAPPPIAFRYGIRAIETPRRYYDASDTTTRTTNGRRKFHKRPYNTVRAQKRVYEPGVPKHAGRKNC